MGHTDRYPEVGLSEALVTIAGGLRANLTLTLLRATLTLRWVADDSGISGHNTRMWVNAI